MYGTLEEARHSTITGWAQEAEYAEEAYHSAFPEGLRNAVEKTIAAVKSE